MMSLRKYFIHIAISFMLSAYFFLSLPVSCAAAASEAVALTQEQYNQLLTALDEQETALSEALMIIEEAQSLLSESDYELTACQEELAEQKQELAQLKMLLKKQNLELIEASKQITAANAYLEKSKQEMIDNDKKHKQKENSLRGERAMWQIISILLGGAVIAK